MRVLNTFGAVTASCVIFASGQAMSQQGTAGFDAGVVSVSADGAWSVLDAMPADVAAQRAYIRPSRFVPAALDVVSMSRILSEAPTEDAYLGGAAPVVVELPMPDGSYDAFLVYQTPIMSPGLRAEFPFMNTYAGESASDASATVRITMTHHGFDAMVMRAGPDVFVDRYSMGNDEAYTSYYGNDLTRENLDWTCHVDTDAAMAVGQREAFDRSQPRTAARGAQTTLRTLQTAITTTGEYTQFFGGGVADGQAAIVTAINRVSGVYERDLSCRMQLVPNNSNLVYTNPGSDPWPSNPNSLSLIDSTIDGIIGSGNYDIGHLVDTGSGGFAQLGVICTSSKGRGYTGLTPPNNDRFYIDYLAHELGHQFAGNHTFNGDSGSCSGGNRNGSTAYEPGSGTTIMGYAGICGNDNTQNFSDDYFHWRSLEEMSSHLSTRTCDTETATGNNLPSANAGPNIAVPLNTPFKLTGSGSDPDGDTLTYTWEQADLGSQRDVNASDNGSSPIFRSFEGTTDPTRYFPNRRDWRDGNLASGEQLPTVARNLDFRLTVRDNNPAGGGFAFDSAVVTVVGGTGPFRVTSQNSPTTVTDSQLTVTWDVAGTSGNPFFENNVNILYSTDAAQTFPIVLASNTPNDGSQTVTLPSTITTQGYIVVEAAVGSFWDMNKAPITVQLPPEPVEFSFPNGLPATLDESTPVDIAVEIDPGTNTLDPATALMIYGFDTPSPFLPQVLVPQGGNMYTTTLPGGMCDQVASFYFSIQDNGGIEFTSPDNPAAPYQATVECSADCLADVNGDGFVTPADFSAWIAAFNTQGEGCDQNGDNDCTPSDFTAWIANYNMGCM